MSDSLVIFTFGHAQTPKWNARGWLSSPPFSDMVSCGNNIFVLKAWFCVFIDLVGRDLAASWLLHLWAQSCQHRMDLGRTNPWRKRGANKPPLGKWSSFYQRRPPCRVLVNPWVANSVLGFEFSGNPIPMQKYLWGSPKTCFKDASFANVLPHSSH